MANQRHRVGGHYFAVHVSEITTSTDAADESVHELVYGNPSAERRGNLLARIAHALSNIRRHTNDIERIAREQRNGNGSE